MPTTCVRRTCATPRRCACGSARRTTARSQRDRRARALRRRRVRAPRKPVPRLLPGRCPKVPYASSTRRVERIAAYTNTIPGGVRARAGRRADHLRGRVADRHRSPPSCGSIRSSCACATPSAEGDTDIEGNPFAAAAPAPDLGDPARGDGLGRAAAARTRPRDRADRAPHRRREDELHPHRAARRQRASSTPARPNPGVGTLTVIQRIVAAELGHRSEAHHGRRAAQPTRRARRIPESAAARGRCCSGAPRSTARASCGPRSNAPTPGRSAEASPARASTSTSRQADLAELRRLRRRPVDRPRDRDDHASRRRVRRRHRHRHQSDRPSRSDRRRLHDGLRPARSPRSCTSKTAASST